MSKPDSYLLGLYLGLLLLGVWHGWLRAPATAMALWIINCKASVGPIPKLGGHTCHCNRARPHALPHTCDCGSWFEPKDEKRSNGDRAARA
jgi:hypothetical protein